MCKAFDNYQTKALKKGQEEKLVHCTKFPVSSGSLRVFLSFIDHQCASYICLQSGMQGADHTCGFYTAHHLMLTMHQAHLMDAHVIQSAASSYAYLYLAITYAYLSFVLGI